MIYKLKKKLLENKKTRKCVYQVPCAIKQSLTYYSYIPVYLFQG